MADEVTKAQEDAAAIMDQPMADERSGGYTPREADQQTARDRGWSPDPFAPENKGVTVKHDTAITTSSKDSKWSTRVKSGATKK